MTTIHKSLLCAALAGFVTLSGCGGSGSSSNSSSTESTTGVAIKGTEEKGPALKIGLIPYEDPQREQASYDLFGNYLGSKTNGQPATVNVATDYSGVVAALESGQIDLAYLNPLSYALATNDAEKLGKPITPVAMPYVIPEGPNHKLLAHGSLTYNGDIFTRVDSGINSIKDLKGKVFAFAQQTSTSGYLYPVAMLLKNGINPKPQSEGGDLKQVFFAGDPGVVPAVLHKQADAGAIFEEGLNLFTNGPSERAQLKVLAKTDPIPNGMFVVRNGFPADETKKLEDAMWNMNKDPQGQKALLKVHAEKLVPPQDALFNPVRQTAKVLNLSLKPAGKK